MSERTVDQSDPLQNAGKPDHAPEHTQGKDTQADRPGLDGPLEKTTHGRRRRQVTVLEVWVDHSEAPQSSSHQGNSRIISILSDQSTRAESRSGCPTGDCPPSSTGQEPSSITPRLIPPSKRMTMHKAGQREPGKTRAGSPTVTSPRITGKQYHGPATRPIRNEPRSIMTTRRSTRLPWLEYPSLPERLSRLPRGDSRCKTIASARGKASAPRARNAPEPPIIVPNRNGVVGMRTAFDVATAVSAPGSEVSARFRSAAVAGASSRSFREGAQEGPLPGT